MENIERYGEGIVPIVAYGNPVLRKKCVAVSQQNETIDKLVEKLWNTLGNTGGAGLAAPQINSVQNVFVVNSLLMYNQLDKTQRNCFFSGDAGIVETFINAKPLFHSKEEVNQIEGCLSIPGINTVVNRALSIEIEYLDKDFKQWRKKYSGYTARVIQHEYDRTIGTLFIDKLSPLQKKMIESRMRKIKKRLIHVDYPIKYS